MQGSFRGLRILVVEDEYLVAMDMERMLNALGAEVVGPIGHLELAQQVAREKALSGAILDVELGGEAVYPLADELLARGVPVILATGLDAAVVPATYERLPRLQKPFDDESLQSAAARAFRRA